MGVDVTRKVEYRGNGAGGVEIFLHAVDKMLFVREKLLLDLVLAVLPSGRRLGEVEFDVFQRGVKACQRGLVLLDDVNGIVDRASVLAGEHEETDRLIAVSLAHVAHGEEIAERLAHLLVVHVDEAVVHPVEGEGLACRALRLCDFVLMVREDQILSAAVEVDGLAEKGEIHRGALDVPAGSALAPRRIPVGFAFFGGLPESEIGAVALDVAGIDALTGASDEVFQRQVRELAVGGEGLGAEIHVALRLVGVTLLHQGGNDLDDLVYILGRLRVNGGGLDAERLDVLPVFLYVALGNGLEVHSFRFGFVDDFVVHIGEILHECHLHAAPFKVAAEGVKGDDGACVADVYQIVYRWAAGIHFHFIFHLRSKFLHLPRQRIKYSHNSFLLKKIYSARSAPKLLSITYSLLS